MIHANKSGFAAGEGRQASLQQFLECAQTVLAELEPK